MVCNTPKFDCTYAVEGFASHSNCPCVFRTQADLVYSVGESAAMGAAGIVIWEKFFPTKNQVRDLRDLLMNSYKMCLQVTQCRDLRFKANRDLVHMLGGSEEDVSLGR